MLRAPFSWTLVFVEVCPRRGIRTLFLMLSIAALAVPAMHAQSRRPDTAPPQGTVQLPRLGGMSGSMIGIRLVDVSADDVKSLKLSKAEGAMVESVSPNSPASTAGIRAKDVIVEFDGEHVRSARHLTRLVSETPAGREVSVMVMRDGRKTELHVKPEADNRFGGMVDPEQLRNLGEQVGRAARDMSRNLPDMAGLANRGRLGVSVQELSPELAAYFG